MMKITVPLKIIVVLGLMALELEFNMVNRAVATAVLLALIIMWYYAEQNHKEQAAAQENMETPQAAGREGTVESSDSDNRVGSSSADHSGHVGLATGSTNTGNQPGPGSVDPGSSQANRGEEGQAMKDNKGRDIFAQALEIVEQAEREQGQMPTPPQQDKDVEPRYRAQQAQEVIEMARQMARRPPSIEPTKMIRRILVQCYGEEWARARFVHYHTFSGNCLFIATIVKQKDDESILLASRVIEMDAQGHMMFPEPVPVAEEDDEEGEDE